jgi:hypothetical protein
MNVGYIEAVDRGTLLSGPRKAHNCREIGTWSYTLLYGLGWLVDRIYLTMQLIRTHIWACCKTCSCHSWKTLVLNMTYVRFHQTGHRNIVQLFLRNILFTECWIGRWSPMLLAPFDWPPRNPDQ